MAGFWNVLGDIAGGVVDFLDPTPGNVASGMIKGSAGQILGGGGGGVIPRSGDVRAIRTGGAAMVPYAPAPAVSDLGMFDYLVPDPIERAIGTMPPAGGGACAGPGGPVIVQPGVGQRLVAPPGYRIVECPKGSGRKVAMRAETARAYGYIRPRRKPPISVKDWRSLMAAERTAKKLDKVVQASNRVTGKARYRRSAKTATASCTARATTRKR